MPEPSKADSALPLDETDEVAAQSGSAASEESPPPNESSPKEASQTGNGDDASTGGFDTLLGKMVIRAGIATSDEVEECNTILKESSSSDTFQTLHDLLIEHEYATQHQLDRLRAEFDAKKSSQQIPGYKIKRKLGSGAMATVFMARQLSLDRLVAIKVLPRKFSDNQKFIDRFYKEGRAAAQLNHPNIVSAFDVGKAGEHHYFVMEYVDGETVHERIKQHKRLDEAEAINIITNIARAMEHAHKRGFIHRDIKPKNIMLSSNGRAKLADLGLARAVSDTEAAKAEVGRAYGTPYYISPEQIRGELKIGPAADIYSLGATFYHMVTGKVPYEAKNPSAVMHKHLKSELVPPDHLNPKISAGCAQVIEMMMAKSPEDRYQDATDLLVDLEHISKGEPPHFARNQFDTASFTAALTDEASAPITIKREEPKQPSFVETPAFTIMSIILAISVLANIVFLIMAFVSD